VKSKTVLNLSICVPNAQSKTSALADNRFSELTVTRRHVVIRKSVLSESCDKTSLPNCSIPNYYRYRVFQVIHILYSCICKSEMATSSKPRVDTNSLSPVRPILNLPYARGRGTVGMNRHILIYRQGLFQRTSGKCSDWAEELTMVIRRGALARYLCS